MQARTGPYPVEVHQTYLHAQVEKPDPVQVYQIYSYTCKHRLRSPDDVAVYSGLTCKHRLRSPDPVAVQLTYLQAQVEKS